MKRVALFAAAIAGLPMIACEPAAAKPPTHWDGLVQVESKRLDLVYLQPGADLRGYTKVLLEPTEVAFAKNWQRDYNRDTRALSTRISDRDVQNAITKGVEAANDIFREAWSKGGFAVVTEPGPDVLRITTGIVNITVTAPDKMTAMRSYNFADEAGTATLFVEARDSMTGALLGRAVDQGVAGDNGTAWRSSINNRADFRQMVENWAKISVRGVSELKNLPVAQP